MRKDKRQNFGQYTLAANVMESLLLNDICMNMIGIYWFRSYVQLRNEKLLISSIHYVTKLKKEKVTSGVVTRSEVCPAITILMLLYSVGFR